jgi:glycosyltransferase involved in cell wall biosynthesis
VEQSIFLARHDRGRGASGEIVLFRADEYLWEQSISDWFRLVTANDDGLLIRFGEFLQAIQPTVIHVHHYLHLGMEMMQLMRVACPTAKIILTLHEYVAICFNHGQMIKPRSNQLCLRGGFEECHMCFPSYAPEDFWLRKHRLQSYLRAVDQFIAPSEFLRQRYISWGIPSEKITVIENCIRRRDIPPVRPLPEGGRRNRFGFFGQVTPFKGLEVLLGAVVTLRREEQRDLVIEINADKLEDLAGELRPRIQSVIGSLEFSGTVLWRGPYEPDHVGSRMASVDWVVVPSTWWENSPMVIQEAFACGRPVICSGIGGMAEKVRDGVDGVHVEPGNIVAWADTLRRLSTDDPAIWDQFRAAIKLPCPPTECAARHLQIANERN